MRTLALLALSATLSGCGRTDGGRISSIALPGNLIVSFPNTADRIGTTAILSGPGNQTAGVDGRTLTIMTFYMQQPKNQLTIDANGNMGLSGSYHSLSSRSAKKDVRSYSRDAVALLARARIVSFRYRGESEAQPAHVGFLAEEAPVPLTDPGHRSFNLNDSVAVTIAATQQLDVRMRTLERRLSALQSEIERLHGRRDRAEVTVRRCRVGAVRRPAQACGSPRRRAE